MLSQKEIILEHDDIVVISATQKSSVTRPSLGVFDICLVHFWARLKHPSCCDWDIFGYVFGNFRTVIKSIPTCPASTIAASRSSETKKKFTSTELVEHARCNIF